MPLITIPGQLSEWGKCKLFRQIAAADAVDPRQVSPALRMEKSRDIEQSPDGIRLIVSMFKQQRAADPHLARGDLRFEPFSALAAGPDGLADLRHLIAAAPAHLKPGGTLLLEHGYDQADAVQALLRASGFQRPRSWTDLSGIRRVSGGHLSE